MSKKHIPDIDIDVGDRDAALVDLKKAGVVTIASQLNADHTALVKHNTGFYMEHIPVDMFDGHASFPYDKAEEFGYHKIDLINYHPYTLIKNREELEALTFIAENEFDYSWFGNEKFFGNKGVTHLGSYFDLCQQYPPSCVLDVAALIALIRPSKKHLKGQPWEYILQEVWNRDGQGYHFKKSHGVAFGIVVLIHMLLIELNRDSEGYTFYESDD